MPLTDAAIRKSKPAPKARKLSDGGGLFLLVASTGGKLWRLKYRFGGKEKLLSLGAYPHVTLARARELRDEAKRQLTEGIDPGQLKKAVKSQQVERAANSFEAVAREWVARHLAERAESHRSRVVSRLERCVFPYLGARAVAEISAPEVLAVARRIESRRAASQYIPQLSGGSTRAEVIAGCRGRAGRRLRKPEATAFGDGVAVGHAGNMVGYGARLTADPLLGKQVLRLFCRLGRKGFGMGHEVGEQGLNEPARLIGHGIHLGVAVQRAIEETLEGEVLRSHGLAVGDQGRGLGVHGVEVGGRGARQLGGAGFDQIADLGVDHAPYGFGDVSARRQRAIRR